MSETNAPQDLPLLWRYAPMHP